MNYATLGRTGVHPRGFVVWLTGLPGAGKTTLAVALAAEVRARGIHPEILDGDEVRRDLCAGLGFSREDRDTNVRRIGFVAAAVARCGGAAIVAAVSPFRASRDEQRRRVESFVEVYCHADLQALVARDPKGLYRRALAGEIAHFTGIDDPYEAPLAPEVTCETALEPVEESLAAIVRALDTRGLLG